MNGYGGIPKKWEWLITRQADYRLCIEDVFMLGFVPVVVSNLSTGHKKKGVVVDMCQQGGALGQALVAKMWPLIVVKEAGVSSKPGEKKRRPAAWWRSSPPSAGVGGPRLPAPTQPGVCGTS